MYSYREEIIDLEHSKFCVIVIKKHTLIAKTGNSTIAVMLLVCICVHVFLYVPVRICFLLTLKTSVQSSTFPHAFRIFFFNLLQGSSGAWLQSMGACVSYSMPAFQEGLEEWVKEKISPQKTLIVKKNVVYRCAEREKSSQILT